MSNPLKISFMCIQFDLFSGSQVAPTFESAKDYDDAAKRAGFADDLLTDPCRDCSLRDFCGDECGRLGFDVSVNNPRWYGWRHRF